MSDECWSEDDDAQAYAEYVVEKIMPELAYVQCVALPALVETVARTSAAFVDFAAAWRQSEIREVAGHPDLAELHVQLDGFYGDDDAAH